MVPGAKEKSPGEDKGLGDRGAARQPVLCAGACKGVRGFLGYAFLDAKKVTRLEPSFLHLLKRGPLR